MFHQNQHPAVALRTVKQSDLSIFYEQQLDPEATSMAEFPLETGMLLYTIGCRFWTTKRSPNHPVRRTGSRKHREF